MAPDSLYVRRFWKLAASLRGYMPSIAFNAYDGVASY